MSSLRCGFATAKALRTRISGVRARCVPAIACAASLLFTSAASAQGDTVSLALHEIHTDRGSQTDTLGPAESRAVAKVAREARVLKAILDAGLPEVDMRLGEMPAFMSLNPSMIARSGVLTHPYRLPGPGWKMIVQTSYANIIEYDHAPDARHLLDAEVARAEVGLRKDIGRNVWVSGALGASLATSGKLDGFLDWYHGLIGFPMHEREARPVNQFADTLVVGGRQVRARSSGGASLSDVRVEGGYRWSPDLQTVVSVTLPTAPVSSLDHRGVVSVSLAQTLRGRFGDRVVMEFSGGGGYTPRTGPMSEMQRRWNVGGSFGTRLRMTGGHSLYGIVFYHSAPYFGTGLATQDSGELTTDFGYVFRSRSGRELRLGLTEDIYRLDQGVDVGLRLSVVW